MINVKVLTVPTLVVLRDDCEVARLTGLRTSRSIAKAIAATAPDRRGSRKMHLVLTILGGVLIMAACGGNGEPASSVAGTTASEAVLEESDPEASQVEETTTTVDETPTIVAVAPTGPETVPLIILDESSQPSLLDVTADDGEAPEAPETLLFRKLGDTYDSLLAPDGHQLTRAEWDAAEGTATITCEEGGTRYDLEFSGLVPDGVYTIWYFPTKEPIGRSPSGRLEDLIASANTMGGGPLGLDNGDENAFTSDSEGSGGLNVLVTDPVPECDLAGGTFLVVAYHMDNRTWGSEIGPLNANAWQGVFIYSPS